MSLPVIDDFDDLFLQDVELLDLRAPVEFAQGAFPCSHNIPLLNDTEREQVGLCYKERGQDKAVELGHELVSGAVKEARLTAWADYMSARPNAALYCFRGGMRSKITQQWLFEKTGKAFPRIEGGYKALRQFLLQQLEVAADSINCTILSGRTGSGKTILLNKLKNKIDLEGLYHHRGSVFGRHVDEQPSQIDIENQLAIELMKFKQRGIDNLIFEDESACIGARRIPECIFHRMRLSEIVLLEVPVEERIDVIYGEYITQAKQEYVDEHGSEVGYQLWADYLTVAIDKIKKRLGGVAHSEIKGLLELGLSEGAKGEVNSSEDAHKQWIHRLLVDYYDPMYDYQLSKKEQRIRFRGSRLEMEQYLSDFC